MEPNASLKLIEPNEHPHVLRILLYMSRMYPQGLFPITVSCQPTGTYQWLWAGILVGIGTSFLGLMESWHQSDAILGAAINEFGLSKGGNKARAPPLETSMQPL